MSGNDGSEERPRGRRDMQALLNFCTEITAREDTTQDSNTAQMDPERRAFLRQVLEGMQVNVAEKMVSCLTALSKEAVQNIEEDTEEQETAFDELEEYCDDLNYAVDLHKIGGFPVIIKCLDSPHSCLRSSAASLIGDVCQNFEYCQKHMLELDVLPKLLNILDKDSEDLPRIKALYAISCIVREFKDGEDKFFSHDGLSYLMRSMQSNVEKLIIKSCFLLSHLLTQTPSCRETVISMGFIEQIVYILRNPETNDINREHCSRVLSNLASNVPGVLDECLRPELGLMSLLNSRLSTIKGIEQYQDEEEHINNLLALFPDDEQDDNLIR